MSHEKQCTITDLPNDVLPHIFNWLDESSKNNCVFSCRFFRFSPFQIARIKLKLIDYCVEGNLKQVERLLTMRPDFAVNMLEVYEQALFQLASAAEQDKMQPLLKKHPELLLKYRPLTDISGVHFEKITLFQHALWTGDVHYMCGMMLDCLPQTEQGELIRQDLCRQYNDLIVNGVDYQLNEVKYKNNRDLTLERLIEALNTYSVNYLKWTEIERKSHWYKQVGSIQMLLPAHIRHHYCDPEESFSEQPAFTKPKLNRSLNFTNWVYGKSELWREDLVKQDWSYGFCVGDWPQDAGTMGFGYVPLDDDVKSDLEALKRLAEVRTNIDRPALIKRLNTPSITLSNDLVIRKYEDIEFTLVS